MREVAGAVVPSLAVAAGVGSVFFVVEHEFVKAASHGIVVGFVLLGIEALGAALCYLGLMRVVAPDVTRDVLGSLRHLARTKRAGDSGPSSAGPGGAT